MPLVLNVHGGPWARDDWGFNPEHQWLANRGYAVLAVNYRGSTGFGKTFINAGDREWAGKMHDDLIDAVMGRGEKDRDEGQGRHLRRQLRRLRHARRAHVHARRFACGVDIVGPSNLHAAGVDPAVLGADHEELASRVGDLARRRARSSSISLAAHAKARSSGRCSSGRARTTRA